MMELHDLLAQLNRGEVVIAGSEAHRKMIQISNEAMRFTAQFNGAYRTPEEVRVLFSQIIGCEVDEGFGLFPPFYTDFGRNIHVGKNVFINSGCHFQDQGGITIGDGALIGHNVVLATINHDFDPACRGDNHPPGHGAAAHPAGCVYGDAVSAEVSEGGAGRMKKRAWGRAVVWGLCILLTVSAFFAKEFVLYDFHMTAADYTWRETDWVRPAQAAADLWFTYGADQEVQFGLANGLSPADLRFYARTEEEALSITAADLAPIRADLIGYVIAAAPPRTLDLDGDGETETVHDFARADFGAHAYELAPRSFGLPELPFEEECHPGVL